MLRDFEPRDQDELRALVLAGLRDRWGDAYDPTFNPDLEDFQKYYVDRGAVVVVCEDDGRLVGTGTIVNEGAGVGRVVRMSVARERRRQGIGRTIVEALVGRARALGMTELRVLTDTPWMSALALYRACGFDELGDDGVDTHFRLDLGQ